MKTAKLLLGVIVMLTFWGLNKASGQWATSGNNIYNTNTGNVGIGNSTPSTLFYVAKNMTEPTIAVRNAGGFGGATYSMIDDVSGAFWKFKATNTGGFKIRDNSNALDVFTIEPNSAANALYIKTGGSLGIGTSTPENSALVDMTSSNKGILVPRMSTVQRTAISPAANGLLVYDSDEGSFWYFNDSEWQELGNSGSDSSFAIVDSDNDTRVTVEQNPDEDMVRIYIAGIERHRFSGHIIEQLNTGQSVFLGEDAGQNDNLSSNFNVFVGYQAGMTESNCEGATGVGYKALTANITGYKNSAFGYKAMTTCETGMRNTAVGAHALEYTQNALSNVAVGYASLISNTGGSFNTAIGVEALRQNTTGNSSVAVGNNALYKNTVFGELVAIGDSALFWNGVGANPMTQNATENVAVGPKALHHNTVGFQNTSTGSFSMYHNSWGIRNSGYGAGALVENTDGDENTAIGFWALGSNTTGDTNVAVGSYALQENVTGRRNTAVGFDAGPNPASPGLINTTALGYNAKTTANNQVRIGNASVTSIGGYANWSNISDERFKSNVAENVPGLNFILKLRPVTYKLDLININRFLGLPESGLGSYKEEIVQTGFLAQEVEIAARSIGYNFSGIDAANNEQDFYGLRYAEFVVPLVKAVQEQQAQIEKLERRVREMESDHIARASK